MQFVPVYSGLLHAYERLLKDIVRLRIAAQLECVCPHRLKPPTAIESERAGIVFSDPQPDRLAIPACDSPFLIQQRMDS